MINILMAAKTKNPSRKTKRAVESGEKLPITLQALRERAGFTRDDGANSEFCEFFANFKFSGDPDRSTAIAIVAMDTILRDPEFLDGTTCCSEGQIDTAVTAAGLILGPSRIKQLETISGERDLEELGSMCRDLSSQEDVKNGIMAARHLWGMFNTVTRSFPSDFFHNGKSDDFQAALLGVAARHLNIFSPDTMNAESDFRRMVASAEKIAELGQDGKFYPQPKNEEQMASSFLFLCKNGRYTELAKSPLWEALGDSGQPSTKALQVCGLKEKKPRKSKAKESKVAEGDLDGDGVSEGEAGAWKDDPVLAGNGAFFVGRSYEEIKARFPGYPGHSTENTYWESCTKHPATHGICCRLYGKMGQLIKSGGIEEGISRAVTNKMVHHNTKFSRLSMLVHLSNGKSFHVHRTRPINWASHGVDEIPFESTRDDDDELGLFAGAKTPKVSKGKSKEGGGVKVLGYELRVVNYSHMPWVNKAISQYMEEAPFIKAPKDEHQELVAAVANELRSSGIPYRKAFDLSSDIYSRLGNRGTLAVDRTVQGLSEAWVKTRSADELETEAVSLIRKSPPKANLSVREIFSAKESPESKSLQGDLESRVLDRICSRLENAESVLNRYGLGEEMSRKICLEVAAQFPAQAPIEGYAAVVEIVRNAGLNVSIDAADGAEVAKLAGGVAGWAVRGLVEPDGKTSEELSDGIRAVIKSGIVIGEDGQKLLGNAGDGNEAALTQYFKLVEQIGSRLGISSKDCRLSAIEGIRSAGEILPEVERLFAQNEGEPSEELRKKILSYAHKYHDRSPLDSLELHNRKMVGGGSTPVSLDAPFGDENENNLYSVVGDEARTAAGGYDFDPDEAAFEVGPDTHWLDRENEPSESSPGFMTDGGNELFAPFSMTRIADSLYRVVSTSGNEQQLRVLKDFASLQLESIAGDGNPEEVKKQITAMLDMVDEQEQLTGEQGAVRRRFLSWIFTSVLNASGVDGQGFDRFGGINSASLKKGLFEKLRRYGMPGIVVVEQPRVDKPEELMNGIKEAKAWGYTSIGVCLPKTASENLSAWVAKGGVSELVGSIRSGEAGAVASVLDVVKNSPLSPTAKQGFVSLLEGRGGPLDGKAAAYLDNLDGAERDLLAMVKQASPSLHQKLVVAKLAHQAGLEVKCLGTEENTESLADAARMDSIVFVGSNKGKAVGQAIASFGVKARVVDGTPAEALMDHVDYSSNPIGKDGKLDKGRLIKGTQIPLARRLLMAAEASHEAIEKSGGKGSL